MNRLVAPLLALALGVVSAPPLHAQTATHLGVPSANMVVLSGTSFSTGTSWSVWQNSTWSSVYGHYTVPTGKVLVVTDLGFEMSGGNGSGSINLALWQGSLQILPAYLLRFNKTNNLQTYERSFTSGIRIPAGISLDFGLYNSVGTASLDNVLVYGYFTN